MTKTPIVYTVKYTVKNVSNTNHITHIPNFTLEATSEEILNYHKEAHCVQYTDGKWILSFYCATEDGLVIEDYVIKQVRGSGLHMIPNIVEHSNRLTGQPNKPRVMGTDWYEHRITSYLNT